MITFLGPLTFVPTVWNAWTLENIDALRVLTWWQMTVINLIMFFTLCHVGSWQLRLLTLVWVITMSLVALAVFVR